MNEVLSEAMPIHNPTSYPQDKRKPGQLANEIIKRIAERPEINLCEIAAELRCSLENIRKVYKQIYENPKLYSRIGGFDFKVLAIALLKRDNKPKTRHLKKDWRGRADWPAKIVAKNLGVGGKDKIAIYAYKHPLDEL